MAHFQLAAGQVAKAVTHRTVEEVWFVVSGQGQMWRQHGDHEEVVPLEPGVCLTIPVGTHFQFRASGVSGVAAVAVTMPPWPGEGEAVLVSGPEAISPVPQLPVQQVGQPNRCKPQAVQHHRPRFCGVVRVQRA